MAAALVASYPPSKWSESELVEGLLQRDEVAWAEFLRRYRSLIYTCIFNVARRHASVLGREDMDDLFGEVCLALLRHDMHKLRSYDPARGNRLSGWIGMIANNAVHDYLRSPMHRYGQVCDEPFDEFALSPVSGPDPVEVLAHQRRWSQFKKVLARLTARDQMFVDLYFAQGLDATVVAERMAISLKTIYSKTHKLRQQLQRSLPGSPPAGALLAASA